MCDNIGSTYVFMCDNIGSTVVFMYDGTGWFNRCLPVCQCWLYLLMCSCVVILVRSTACVVNYND